MMRRVYFENFRNFVTEPGKLSSCYMKADQDDYDLLINCQEMRERLSYG